jgi:hypothetical protein
MQAGLEDMEFGRDVRFDPRLDVKYRSSLEFPRSQLHVILMSGVEMPATSLNQILTETSCKR